MTEETDLDLEFLAETVSKIREELAKVQNSADKKLTNLKDYRDKTEAKLKQHYLKDRKGKPTSVSWRHPTTL